MADENNLSNQALYDLVRSVNKEFYELVYQDPWFKRIFRNIDQQIIESQQTDFIVGALGGPKNYSGRTPQDAHPHIFIDEDIWQYREFLLVQAFDKVKAPTWLRDKWLKIDNAFKMSMMKGSLTDCTKRYTMDEIIYEPRKKSSAA